MEIQLEYDYQVDKFLLSVIAENTQSESLLSKINEIMKLLSEKSECQAEVIQTSINEQENERD